MPWTTPADLSTADLVTESIWDNQVAGNLTFLFDHFRERTFHPAMGWKNKLGTATLVQPINALDYWEFLDNNAIDRIDFSLPLPDLWAGRTISKAEAYWATDGTSTAGMAMRIIVYNYVIGTNLANGTGTTVWDAGTLQVIPNGTAHQMVRTSVGNAGGGSGVFNVGADVFRVLFQRNSSDASDTNTNGMRLYGVRLEVS